MSNVFGRGSRFGLAAGRAGEIVFWRLHVRLAGTLVAGTPGTPGTPAGRQAGVPGVPTFQVVPCRGGFFRDAPSSMGALPAWLQGRQAGWPAYQYVCLFKESKFCLQELWTD